MPGVSKSRPLCRRSQGLLATAEIKPGGSEIYLGRRLQNVLGVHPDTFDADVGTVKGSLVYIARTSRGERNGIDLQRLRRKSIGWWKDHPGAANCSELTQTFSRGWTERIEAIKGLC